MRSSILLYRELDAERFVAFTIDDGGKPFCQAARASKEIDYGKSGSKLSHLIPCTGYMLCGEQGVIVADVVDSKTRSRMMAGIRSKNTKPEMILRRELHRHGFRYRLHDSRLPGKPDLVLPMYKAVIFVHGCFWHRHIDCWWNTSPSSNTAFWKDKLDRNAERDMHHVEQLRIKGWRIAIVWECSFRLSSAELVAGEVRDWLNSEEPMIILPATTRRREPAFLANQKH